MYYFVASDGSHGSADYEPQNVNLIDKATYDLISENRDLLDIKVNGSQVIITPSMSKYLSVVNLRLDRYLESARPSFQVLQELNLAIEYSNSDTVMLHGSEVSIQVAKDYIKDAVGLWQERNKEHARLKVMATQAEDFAALDRIIELIGG